MINWYLQVYFGPNLREEDEATRKNTFNIEKHDRELILMCKVDWKLWMR